MKQDKFEPTNVIKVITSSGGTGQETRGGMSPSQRKHARGGLVGL